MRAARHHQATQPVLFLQVADEVLALVHFQQQVLDLAALFGQWLFPAAHQLGAVAQLFFQLLDKLLMEFLLQLQLGIAVAFLLETGFRILELGAIALELLVHLGERLSGSSLFLLGLQLRLEVGDQFVAFLQIGLQNGNRGLELFQFLVAPSRMC